MASDKALMEANQHQELLDAGHDAELTRQAKSALRFTGSILPTLTPASAAPGGFPNLV